ncbi:unnamed protein product [Heterobilharzia americana]|nr:unnamed protein product [Heterobilharzia americana]
MRTGNHTSRSYIINLTIFRKFKSKFVYLSRSEEYPLVMKEVKPTNEMTSTLVGLKSKDSFYQRSILHSLKLFSDSYKNRRFVKSNECIPQKTSLISQKK